MSEDMETEEKREAQSTADAPLFPREYGRSRIDCFTLLLELERAGVTNTRAAFELGVPRSTLRHWKEGSEPGYSDGCRLIELHVRLCS